MEHISEKNFGTFFGKIFVLGKNFAQKMKIFYEFYSFGNSLQFGTNIMFLAYPEAEI